MDRAAVRITRVDLPRGNVSAPVAGDIRTEVDAAPAISERLHREWADLAASASEPNPFAEAWFTAAGHRQLAGEGDAQFVQVWEGETRDCLLGVLPLQIARGYGRLPVRHVTNWLHFHCFLGTPLVRAGREADFWTAVLRMLDGAAWARGFLHLTGLVEDGPVHRGLVAACQALGRRCDTVHRAERALLESDLSPQAYFEATVRKKKRKELKRLAARLSELGTVSFRRLAAAEDVAPWCDDFLRLERSGWKGRSGSALACSPATEAFFREAMSGAFEAGRLDILRMDLGDRPIAMLVNFLTPPGSFSFKIAFDEDYARFSPGVLIQIENLNILSHPEIGWMDSCAVEDHPMINSLWGERRPVVRVTVPLKGAVRGLAFRLCRLAEDASAAVRARRAGTATEGQHDDD